MAYLRLSPATPRGDLNEDWTPRPRAEPTPETWGQRRHEAPLPPRRRGGGDLVLGLIAMLIGAWGLWLLLGAAITAPTPVPALTARPLVFQVPKPGDAAAPDVRPGLQIILTEDVRPATHPETWGALPTAPLGPVAATPLADVAPRDDTTGCRDAPTLAAQMTCIDPTLREAEGRMAAAYDAVLAAGVLPAVLGRSQARWLAARDAAAQSSPEDLLALYQTRESLLRNFAVAMTRRAGSVGVAARTSPVTRGPVLGVPTPAVKRPAGRTEVSAVKRDRKARPAVKSPEQVRGPARTGKASRTLHGKPPAASRGRPSRS
jgi:uncharacterized protein